MSLCLTPAIEIGTFSYADMQQVQQVPTWRPPSLQGPPQALQSPQTNLHGYGACCTIESARSASLNGYVNHPAVFDASFHLGASLGAMQPGDRRGSRSDPIKIPASVGAYLHNADGAQQRDPWAWVGGLRLRPQSAILSDYKIISSNNAVGSEVIDLLAKPIKSMGSQPSSLKVQLKYESHWKAINNDQLAKTSFKSPSHNPSQQLIWQITSHEGHLLWRMMPNGKISQESACMTSLQAVKLMCEERAGKEARHQLIGTIHTTSSSCCSGRPEKDLLMGGAMALLKTAAQEQPIMSWQCTADCDLNSAIDFSLPNTDAFGGQRSASILYLPQMLPVPERNTAYKPTFEQLEQILVFGGTGELGKLVGSWSNTSLARHILLASRSGHASQQATANITSMESVTLTRCDIASKEEARQCCSTALKSGFRLRGIMHAGKIKYTH